ncbi:MAG: glycosyltransferase family 2 protein [Aquificaceae bacterium]|nr:glycosyltransferase family 2 protein [Aquificaceae bacterium]MCX7989168.1 glycosyltransferase family 2 protein [Aquificaceae bacterium]MDW8033047.1 glycosyltransferase family 2 protein [Aquificaceae bacterium]
MKGVRGLSALILTKDEEDNIGRAIKSLQGLAEEVIVLDSGSKDRTVEIAKSMGARVFFREWQGYPAQLNYGVELCSGEWVLVVDADEEVSERLKESIKEVLSKPEYEVYKVCRRTYYLGGFLRHAWYPEWRVRLFKKGRVTFQGELHETAVYSSKAGKTKGDLYHYSYKNLKDQYRKTLKYAEEMAHIMHRSGKRFRTYHLLFNPFWHFLKVYLFQLGFLDGLRGFLVASSAFIYTFLKYKFLLELELSERKEKLW